VNCGPDFFVTIFSTLFNYSLILKRQKAIMEETQKTQRQLKTEALQREQANRSFVNGAERLIQWMAFKDFLRNDFYQSLLDLATAREDLGTSDDFGFSIYLYDTSHKRPHFFSTGVGIGGLCSIVSQAMEWLDEDIGKYEQLDTPPVITAGEEMENGYLRDNLDAFSDVCEAVGDTGSDVNLYIAFYPTGDDMPETMDFWNIETESLRYPNSLRKKFEIMLDDIMDS
jgi:hypothetical protein